MTVWDYVKTLVADQKANSNAPAKKSDIGEYTAIWPEEPVA